MSISKETSKFLATHGLGLIELPGYRGTTYLLREKGSNVAFVVETKKRHTSLIVKTGAGGHLVPGLTIACSCCICSPGDGTREILEGSRINTLIMRGTTFYNWEYYGVRVVSIYDGADKVATTKLAVLDVLC